MAPRGTKSERGKPAIEDLGFRPNGNAASLRNRHSRLVGLVQLSITNSFFAQMASEFGKLSIAAGYRAARALSGLGHRAIAVLVPDMVMHPNQHRTRGVERALREADAADGCRVVVGGQAGQQPVVHGRLLPGQRLPALQDVQHFLRGQRVEGAVGELVVGGFGVRQGGEDRLPIGVRVPVHI